MRHRLIFVKGNVKNVDDDQSLGMLETVVALFCLGQSQAWK
jgi:hypothetical protein